ncbi:MAG: hypothetical protein HGA31_00355 [Candidatus Moranbacteria bacterium]|nr:hypothetical protein [Candidatus Moranbacteria bacterium]
MAMDTKEEVIGFVKDVNGLDDKKKAEFIAMLERGDDPIAVLDGVEDALYDEIDKAFEEDGGALDENDPEYQAAYRKYTDDLDAAKNEFEDEIAAIEREAGEIEKQTGEAVDSARADDLRTKLLGGE